jgi:hypothetical protein
MPLVLTMLLLLTMMLLLFIIRSLKMIERYSSSRAHLTMASRLLLLEELPSKSDLLALLAVTVTCFSLWSILLNQRI